MISRNRVKIRHKDQIKQKEKNYNDLKIKN